MMQKPVSSEIPRGVGCPPPPGMDPRKGKGKLMCIKVRMLDDTVGVFHLGHKALGQALFDEVCRHLNLLESDYFGLEFIDSYGNRVSPIDETALTGAILLAIAQQGSNQFWKCWLDKEKSILRQIMAAQSDARFFFIVKFYTPNPSELEEEYTRYLFALQLRRDLAKGELLCNENTAAMLVACIVQSECGDFSPSDYPDPSYLAAAQFVPNQSPAFQLKVMEQHKKLVGMSPAEADFNLLETARRCDFYGVRLHGARDLEGIEVALAVVHMGIKVFHNLNCVTTFSWAKVRKLSFKRKRLMIKIHPDSNQQYKEIIEFLFENRVDCKNFWKKCVEHHSFFRCPEPVEQKRDSKRRYFHSGSHFHYQGRTQKQLIDYVREHRKRREPFERPLRRSGALALHLSVNSTMLQGGGAFLQNAATNQQNQQRAFFVMDRIASEYQLDGMAMNADGGQKHVNFPSICHQQQRQMKGDGAKIAMGMGLANGETTNNNGSSRKPRPKSALLENGSSNSQQQNLQRNIGKGQPPSHHDPMQQSCHGAILPVNTHEAMQQNGISHHQNQQRNMIAQQQQQAAIAAFHQQMDPMSMSLPNVLAPSALQTDNCFVFAAGGPLKSMSGENFHVMEQRRRENDNQSEDGSYRIGGGDGAYGGPLNSSQSDVGSMGPSSGIDPRIFQTTFTTKRVGNVIMKKVTPTTAATNGSSAGISGPNHQHRSTSSSSSTRPATGTNRRQHQPQTQIAPSIPSNGQNNSSIENRPFASSQQIGLIPTKGSTIVPPLDGIGSGYSSTCCSDYSLASSSAPTSARSAQQGRQGGRLRYAPTGQMGGSGFAARLRHEIPVAIDGPPVPIQSASAGCTPSPIIRPVLLPSPPGRRQSVSSTSTSAQSTPTQSMAIQQMGASNNGARRPLVMKAPGVAMAGAKNAMDTKFVPITKLNDNIPPASAQSSKKIVPTPSNAVGSPQGPMTGRVIRKEDLMITTNGIELKPLEEKPQQDRKNAENEGNDNDAIIAMDQQQQQKPKVPPKPDLETLQFKIAESVGIELTIGKQNAQKDGEEEQQQQRHRTLLDPLERILMDVQAINDALDGTATTTTAQRAHQMPAAISIQSEERPDLKTVHLFNGGGGIGPNSGGAGTPYTLTVRDLSLSARNGGKQSAEMKEAGGKSVADKGSGLCEHSSRLGKSSIELVNRRCLPSQDSYSSQDHSISPTNADTGNVLEYVMRRRSQSSDRAFQGGDQLSKNQPKMGSGGKRRSAERRMTQSVEFGSNLATKTEEIRAQNEEKKGGENVENAVEKLASEIKYEMQKEMPKMDEAPSGILAEQSKESENEMKKGKETMGMEEKRLLETDF